jgi:deoxycytidylate deaminase
MNNRRFRFLKVAKEMALKSTEMKRQFGVAIVDGNKVIATGRNRKSHPKIPTITSQNGERRYFGLHAEIDALLKCDFSVRNMVIYIWGQNVSTGNLCYSGPCDLCTTLLRERGIKEAIFPMKYGGGFNVVII